MDYAALLADYRRLAHTDRGAARRVARRYLAGARRADDGVHEARARVLLGELDLAAGRLRAAARAFEQAAGGLAGAQAAPALLGAVQARALLADAPATRRTVAALRRTRLEPLPRAYAEVAIGNARAALGDEAGAEEAYRRALDALGRRRRPDAVAVARATAQLHLGVRLVRRGERAGALRMLERASAAFEQRGDPLRAAVARHNRGWALGVTGDAEAALGELRAAREAFAAGDDRRRAALVDLDVAALYARFGDHERAAGLATGAARELARVPAPLDRARALLAAADARGGQGRSGAARGLAKRAAALFEDAGDRAGAARARVRLGRDLARSEAALRRAGHWIGALEARLARARAASPAAGRRLLDRARREYPAALRAWIEPERQRLAARAARGRARLPALRRSVEAVERLRAAAPTGPLRAAVLVDRTTAYAELARALIDRGRPRDLREAFLVLDRARARTLSEEIEREAPGLTASPRARAERRRLERLWRALEARDRGPGDLRGTGTALLAEVARAERAWLDRVEESGGGTGAGARLDVRLPRAPCLAFECLDGEVLGLLAADGAVSVWSCGPLGPLRRELDAFGFQVARRLHGADDAQAALASLERLAERLLGPAAPLPARGPLAVVLPPVLGDLPLGALPRDGVPLLERLELQHAPMARPAPARRRARSGALLVGIEDEALPDVRREIAWLAHRLDGAEVLRGRAAGRRQVLAALGRHGIVHLAGHADTRADLPPMSALPLRDGRLTAADLAEARLGGSLVVLSACRTGDPSLRWRGEALAGFPRALLAAGADAVVASRWEVPDAVAFAWTRALYPRLLETGPGRAVAEAARAMRESHRHPADWAAFLLIRPGTSEEERP